MNCKAGFTHPKELFHQVSDDRYTHLLCTSYNVKILVCLLLWEDAEMRPGGPPRGSVVRCLQEVCDLVIS